MWALLLIAALPTTRLEVRAPALPCRVEAALREKVAARLGRVPFADDATERLVVSFHREGRFVAVLENAGATRRLESSSCEELVDAVALTVALILEGVEGPLLVSAPAPAAAPSEPAPPPVAPLPFELWGGPSLSAGLSGVAFGGRFGFAFTEVGPLSAGVELRGDAQLEVSTPFGDFTPFSLGAAGLVCPHTGKLRACASVGASVFIPLGTRVQAGAVAASFIGGLRVGWSFPVGAFFVRPELELTFLLPPPAVTAGASVVWRGSLFLVGLTVSFGRGF